MCICISVLTCWSPSLAFRNCATSRVWRSWLELRVWRSWLKLVQTVVPQPPTQMCVCVCVCVRVCACVRERERKREKEKRERERECVCVWERERVCVCVCVCMLVCVQMRTRKTLRTILEIQHKWRTHSVWQVRGSLLTYWSYFSTLVHHCGSQHSMGMRKKEFVTPILSIQDSLWLTHENNAHGCTYTHTQRSSWLIFWVSKIVCASHMRMYDTSQMKHMVAHTHTQNIVRDSYFEYPR